MGWVWSTLGVLGVTLGVLFLALSVLVYAVAPRRTINRALSLYLFAMAANVGCGGGLMYLVDDYGVSRGFQFVAYAAGAMGIVFYAMFLSRALRSRLVSWMRAPAVLIGFVALVLVVEVLLFVRSDLFSVRLYQTSYGTWENEGGWLADGLFLSFGVMSFIGILAALSTWIRSARGSEERRRARLYTMAFAFQDLPIVIYAFWWTNLADSPLKVAVGFTVYSAMFLFPPLLTYALLRGQLFDIDIKLKLTLRRGVVVSAFVVVFLLVSQIVENIVDARLGYVAGGAATTLLLLALSPLQRAADRLSNAAMPAVQDNEVYRSYRKLEVYREAFEAFALDGQVSDRERSALERLRTKLGLTTGLVSKLENEFLMPAAPRGPSVALSE